VRLVGLNCARLRAEEAPPSSQVYWLGSASTTMSAVCSVQQ